MTPLEIDGSYGEGGGQVLRMVTSLSALTQTPVRVVNVRARRKRPGLAAQHVAAVRGVADLCAARVRGVEIGSPTVEFFPGPLRSGRYSSDVGTAGSVVLVLQAVLPAAFHVGDVELRVRGGTDVPLAPPLDYFRKVFLRWLSRLGGRAECEVLRRGYYPRGGGEVVVRVHEAARWAPLVSEGRAEANRIEGAVHVSNLDEDIVRRMAVGAKKRLSPFLSVRVHTEVLDASRAGGPGGAIVLWADADGAILAGSALAERGKRAEVVGDEAASALEAELHAGATVDVHAADQILPYLAMASGPSSFLVREVTEHTRTMMWLLRSFLPVQFETTVAGALARIVVRPQRGGPPAS